MATGRFTGDSKQYSSVNQTNVAHIVADTIRTNLQQIDEPWKVVVGFILIFFVVYSEKFSNKLQQTYSISLRSFGGRLLSLAFVLTIATLVGWVYAVLAAMMVLLLMRDSSSTEEKENDVSIEQFSDLVVKARQGNKWFIEKVLEEEPVQIEEDRVNTSAVQG